MNLKTIEDARDTYKWHIKECHRMLWTLSPKDGEKLINITDDLFKILDIWYTKELDEYKPEVK
jgi:hypothetical protein